MSNENKQPLEEAVEETIELAHQAIQQTRAEIARSQALSQAEADLAQSINQIGKNQDDLAIASDMKPNPDPVL
ncbi:hypothetical protein [Microvirga sp. M2]|uniref:hypothetical protein n=1 Tax=Microvirga sp. M2 TaxID=3073270 RepID=UPI0039C2F5B7